MYIKKTFSPFTIVVESEKELEMLKDMMHLVMKSQTGTIFNKPDTELYSGASYLCKMLENVKQ